ISGFNVAVDIAGANSGAFILDQPIDVDTQRARKQSIKSATNQFLDNVTWTKGAHTVQFGGDFRRIATVHFRDDKVVGAVSTPVAEIGASGNVSIRARQSPPVCGPGVASGCLRLGGIKWYNQHYAGWRCIVG